MITEKLYDKDSFIKDFEATVLECYRYFENYCVILDKTAFFPESAGQGCDKGVLGDTKVLDVQIKDGKILHITDKPLQVWNNVKGSIDFDRRFDFMQQHSGEHIISGVAHSLYGCENVGFHLSEDIVTLDFDKILDSSQLEKIEKLSNSKIWDNVRFFTYYPDSESLKNLNYRSKKELDGDIRIVEIENTDICACCAPHVKTAGQIGLIKLLNTEKIRGGTRIEIKCGGRALDDYNQKYKNTLEISAMLCVKQNEVSKGVKNMLEHTKTIKSQLSDYKTALITHRIEKLDLKNSVTCVFEEDLSPRDLQHFADSLFKKAGGLRAVFTPAADGFSFAICGEVDKLDSFFADFKNRFAVKGGGRNGMVQGTAQAEKSDLIDFFEKSAY